VPAPTNLILRPIVDQYAPADAEISDEPHGLDFSTSDDHVDGLGVREGLDERVIRQLSPAGVRLKTLQGKRNRGALNDAVSPIGRVDLGDVLREPFAQLGLGAESMGVFEQTRHGWVHHDGSG
jgi:hypothetical protein